MKKPKILCVIPARKGSQGIKDKNMKRLNGKPLLQWTIESALKSRLISKIVLSSDSEKMIKFVKKNIQKMLRFLLSVHQDFQQTILH